MARRVLPTPPGPVTVVRRDRLTKSATSASSTSRAMNRSGAAGRLPPLTQRSKGRELLVASGDPQLGDRDRLGHVPQPMKAEIDDLGVLDRTSDERRGGRRQHDLAAVRRRHEPGTSVEGGAEVVLTTFLGLTGVQPHADLDRRTGPRLVIEASLGRDRSGDPVGGALEGDGERVTRRREDIPAIALDGLTHQHVVAAHGIARRLGVALPQARRPLDVGEQERDRP